MNRLASAIVWMAIGGLANIPLAAVNAMVGWTYGALGYMLVIVAVIGAAFALGWQLGHRIPELSTPWVPVLVFGCYWTAAFFLDVPYVTVARLSPTGLPAPLWQDAAIWIALGVAAGGGLCLSRDRRAAGVESTRSR